MAGNGRARSALMRNLPKKGWSVEGDKGTFGDISVDFGESNWKMSKGGAEIASGDYGRTQMADVKKAAKEAGSPFDPAGGGGGKAPKKASGDAKAKQAAAKKNAKKAEEPGE